ncbi:MAG: hypothetical protein HOW73_00530 [Polyangiaceae bacterium]|nr:hypothetical protein [Polyangiaceae bacterium]
MTSARLLFCAGSLLSATLALGCGANVDLAPDGDEGGAPNGGAPDDGAPGGNGGNGGSTDVSTGGAAPNGLPLACEGGEGVLVAASSPTSEGVIVVANEGAWAAPHMLPPASQMAAYVDVYGALGIFWIGSIDDIDERRFVTTHDGRAFIERDVFGWEPSAYAPLYKAEWALVGSEEGLTSVAYFDPDAMDWYPLVEPTMFVPSSVAWDSVNGGVLLIHGWLGELCSQMFFETQWMDSQCDTTHPVATAIGGEISLPPPRAVTLPDGSIVAIYYAPSDSSLTLAAATWQFGAWSPAVTTPDVGFVVATTATPGGDVLVASVSTDGNLFVQRLTPGVGFDAPVLVDSGIDIYYAAAAPGVCGDDAVLAYTRGSVEGGELRVARIRGELSETTQVASLPDQPAWAVDITTRPAAL